MTVNPILITRSRDLRTARPENRSVLDFRNCFGPDPVRSDFFHFDLVLDISTVWAVDPWSSKFLQSWYN